MKTIAIAGQKCNSGKTTTARCLAAVLAREYNQNILLVDMDPQAKLSAICGVDGESASLAEALTGVVSVRDILVNIAPHIHLIPSDIALAHTELACYQKSPNTKNSFEDQLKNCLETVNGDFDITILDLPSSLGPLAISGLVAAQDVLVPSRPDFINLRALALLVKTINDLRQGMFSITLNTQPGTIGVLPTYYNPRLRHHIETLSAWKTAGLPILDVYVPESPQHIEALAINKPLTNYDSHNPVIEAYQKAAGALFNGHDQ